MSPAGTLDSHQHFWDPAHARYPWMTDAVAPLRRAFGPADLAPELALAGIEHSVVVQARSDLVETGQLCELAHRHDFVRGVVGWLPLQSAEMPEALVEVLARAGGDRLVGVRHQVEDEPDRDWLSRPIVVRNIRAAAAQGLAVDLLIRLDQMDAAVALASDLDDVRFVVDHLAKPVLDPADLPPWSAQLARLASLENVCCKLSGFATFRRPAGTTFRDAMVPFVDALIEMFGPGRLMYGSDWPVSTLEAGYQDVLAAAQACTAALTETERADVFGGSARRFYRLDVLNGA